MDSLILIRPSEALIPEIEDFRNEHIQAGEKHIHGSAGLMHYDQIDEWIEYEKRLRRDVPEGLVPADTYFLYDTRRSRILGTTQIRHYLNEGLTIRGGHIGYGLRPSERGKGFGKKMLALALKKAKELGLNKVLVTCDKDNIASAKTIIANGGVLENELVYEGVPIQRYWIQL
mgnify:FL=1